MSRWICTDQSRLPEFARTMDSSASWTNKATFIAEMEDDKPIAICMFDLYNGRSIHCHGWVAKGKRPSRVWWWVVHDYAYWQCGVTNVIGVVASDNKEAIRICQHMGGKLTATIPNYYRTGADQLIFVGTEETSQHWNRYENGRKPGPVYSRMKVPEVA